MWFSIENFRILENFGIFERHFFSSQKIIFSWSWKKKWTYISKQKMEIFPLKPVPTRFEQSVSNGHRLCVWNPWNCNLVGFFPVRLHIIQFKTLYDRIWRRTGKILLSCNFEGFRPSILRRCRRWKIQALKNGGFEVEK